MTSTKAPTISTWTTPTPSGPGATCNLQYRTVRVVSNEEPVVLRNHSRLFFFRPEGTMQGASSHSPPPAPSDTWKVAEPEAENHFTTKHTGAEIVERFRRRMTAEKNEPTTRVVVEAFQGSKTIRRVHAVGSSYQVGWVFDGDVDACAVCKKEFSWWAARARHHCRECGQVVCHVCSPHKTIIPNFDEGPGGSRQCSRCHDGNGPQNSLGQNDENVAAFKAAYERMRELIPPDVARSSVGAMIGQGLPEEIAQRLWKCRSLWLVVMAPEDIAKVHIADFRSKYDWHGLDITELRAIYHVLPEWDRTSASSVKAEWKDGLRTRLEDLARKQQAGTLSRQELRNHAYDEVDASKLALYDASAVIEARYTKQIAESPVLFRAPAIATTAPLLGESAEKRQEQLLEEEINAWCLPSPTSSDAVEEAPLDEFALLYDDACPKSPRASRRSSHHHHHTTTITNTNTTTAAKSRRGSLTNSRKSIGGLMPRRLSGLGSPSERASSPQAKNLTPFRVPLFDLGSAEGKSDGNETENIDIGAVPGLLAASASAGDSTNAVTFPATLASTAATTAASAIAALLSGDAYKAKEILAAGAKIDCGQATALLLNLVQDPDSLTDARATLELLLDLGASIDAPDESGRTPIIFLFASPELGSILVRRGADILLDDDTGVCALQTTMEYGIEWLLDEFVASGREEQFLANGDEDERAKYGSILLFGGLATKLDGLLADKKVPIFTEEEVHILQEICGSNMENWREPVETYELLERMGAVYS